MTSIVGLTDHYFLAPREATKAKPTKWTSTPTFRSKMRRKKMKKERRKVWTATMRKFRISSKAPPTGMRMIMTNIM